MTDIAAANVTVSLNKFNMGDLLGVVADITYGNGSLTVPTGGIPLAKGKLGFKKYILAAMYIESSASGFKFEYDISAETLVPMYYDYDDTGDDEAIKTEGTAPAATTCKYFFIGA